MIRLQRILVPTDFSDSARHALSYGVSFAREFEAELLLLHVVETIPVGYASDLFPVPMAEVFQEMSGYAKAELAKLGALAREKKVAVREMVTQGKPSAETVGVAGEDSADILVHRKQGTGVCDKSHFVTNTHSVAREDPCLVLTCRLAEHEFV